MTVEIHLYGRLSSRSDIKLVIELVNHALSLENPG